MEEAERQMHLRAGRAYGRMATCGRKQDYKSEETASDAAERMSIKFERALEAYPCAWCDGWHIGREMTPEERRLWAFIEPDNGSESTHQI